MDIIRRYTPNIRHFDDKHEACEELIKQFMANYETIVEECESQFICKYFMSAILAFCADIDYKNHRQLKTFIRFFVTNQSGIWDIWSVYQFEAKQWKAIEKCLDIKLTNLRNKNGFHALKYIIKLAHKLHITFIDPQDNSVIIRFIDFPRFDAIESKSEFWRNLHLPVIDCTLLPENPHILRLLLQYGAHIPTIDYQIQHITNRVCHTLGTATSDQLIKKLMWVKLATNCVTYQCKLYIELTILAKQITKTLSNEFNYSKNVSLIQTIPRVPSLKQMTRYSIRELFRSQNTLPDSIAKLDINPILKDYLNLIYL